MLTVKVKPMNKILICDDDAGILDIVSIVLTEAGYDVSTTLNSQEVVGMAETLQPQLIFLDLWMPNASGDVIAKFIKENPKTAHIPVILFSAAKDITSISESGSVDGFISKPFDIEELEMTAKKHIEQALSVQKAGNI